MGFILESFSVFSIKNKVSYYCKNMYKSLSMSSMIESLYLKFFYSINSESDGDCMYKDVIFSWLVFVSFFIYTSLITLFNEEVDTSLLEVLFESIFIGFSIYIIPDICLYYFKFLGRFCKNKCKIALVFLLPFLELLSSLIKSIILGFRINTNFIAGHLIFSFILVYIESCYMFNISFNVFSLLSESAILFFLETLTVFLQIYILLTLTVVYSTCNCL